MTRAYKKNYKIGVDDNGENQYFVKKNFSSLRVFKVFLQIQFFLILILFPICIILDMFPLIGDSIIMRSIGFPGLILSISFYLISLFSLHSIIRMIDYLFYLDMDKKSHS